MKNKKLFAILTLVCFMFTLMPVAAFAVDVYAEVDEDSAYITTGNAAKIELSGLSANAYIVYAYKDGAFSKDFGFQLIDFAADADGKVVGETLPFDKAGNYEIHVVNKAGAVAAQVFTAETVGAKLNVKADYTNAQVVTLLEDRNEIVMLDNAVAVNPPSGLEYAIDVVSGLTAGENGSYVLAKADSTYTETDVVVKVGIDSDKDGNVDSPVAQLPVAISTNSSAVSIVDADEKTNGAGLVKFTVSGSVAGDFKIYVEFGYKASEVIDVKVGALAPAQIETVKEPAAPVALGAAIINAGVTFNVTDANGNATAALVESPADGHNYKVVIDEKPAGSTLKGQALCIDLDTMKLAGDNDGVVFDKEGDYAFRVVLNNGAYATAKVTVKEFQTPVELKLTYKQNAVELGGKAELDSVVYVDANGVTKNALGKVTLSANGYAIDRFGTATGNVVVKDDEKYVGSKINVIAVCDRYNLTAVAELVVANEAAAVKYATTEADVAVNNTLTANVVDLDGNKVALNSSITNANISYIVLEKPENAKVAISTKDYSKLATAGEFKVSFTASEIGTYKVQTLVRYEQTGRDDAQVVKYYSGIETITVGNTGINDVVVMSVGSNEIVKNGKVAVIDAAPIVENNRTFVPFRALAEAFGATVAFDEATQAVTAELNGTTVVMTIGSATYTVNGVEKTADVAPFINGSRTMVPVRFVAQAFGITVTPTYDDNGATADILFAK